jgi:hypothetical protein
MFCNIVCLKHCTRIEILHTSITPLWPDVIGDTPIYCIAKTDIDVGVTVRWLAVNLKKSKKCKHYLCPSDNTKFRK